MNLSVNCGVWNSIFAIPCDVVDKHIKLAGSAQLKVLLFILRYAGQNISTDKNMRLKRKFYSLKTIYAMKKKQLLLQV